MWSLHSTVTFHDYRARWDLPVAEILRRGLQTSWFPAWLHAHKERRLPLVPLWFGFAVNTLVYYCVLVAVRLLVIQVLKRTPYDSLVERTGTSGLAHPQIVAQRRLVPGAHTPRYLVWEQTMKNSWFPIVGSFFLLVSSLAFGSEAGSAHARTMEVTVLVPADLQKYTDMINEEDWKRAAELPFVRKKVVVPYSRDVIRATADAAAKEMPDQAGPGVNYLKINNGTAYVLLNMDCDGWAGVGLYRAMAHPVVEKTLLQFKNITRVVFHEAPGERCLYEKQYIHRDHAQVARACVDLVRSGANDNIYYTRDLVGNWHALVGSGTNDNNYDRPITNTAVPAVLRYLHPSYIRTSAGTATVEMFGRYGYRVSQSHRHPKKWTVYWYDEAGQTPLATISHD